MQKTNAILKVKHNLEHSTHLLWERDQNCLQNHWKKNSLIKTHTPYQMVGLPSSHRDWSFEEPKRWWVNQNGPLQKEKKRKEISESAHPMNKEKRWIGQ